MQCLSVCVCVVAVLFLLCFAKKNMFPFFVVVASVSAVCCYCCFTLLH